MKTKEQEFRICPNTGVKITRDMVIGCYSDTYKEIHGLRPRWIDWSDCTMEEIGIELSKLQTEAKAYFKELTILEREARKERSRMERKYQKLRKDAKTPFPPATYSIGEILGTMLN